MADDSAGPAPEIWVGLDEDGRLAALAASLATALAQGRPLVIDLRAAGAPQAAGLQLLVAAARSGDTFVLREPSEAFVEGCTRLGMFGTLMTMPMEAPE